MKIPRTRKLRVTTVTVPYGGVGCCLGPEGNGVSSGEGGKGGPAPQTRSEISSQTPARKEVTWSRRKKERRIRCDEEDPECTQ
jgi:hypothetical protein